MKINRKLLTIAALAGMIAGMFHSVQAQTPATVERMLIASDDSHSINDQLEVLSRENISRLELIGHFGEGGFSEELSLSPDGKWLAVAADGEAVLYDAEKGERLVFFNTPTAVRAIAISPDSRSLALIYWVTDGERFDGSFNMDMKDLLIPKAELRVLSLPDGEIQYQIPLTGRGCGDQMVWNLQYTADGTRLIFHDPGKAAVSPRLNALCMLDSADGSLVNKIDIKPPWTLRDYALSADSSTAWIMLNDPTAARAAKEGETLPVQYKIQTVNLAEGTLSDWIAWETTEWAGNDFLRLSPDEKWLAAGFGPVHLFSTEDGKEAAVFYADPISAAAFSSDGNFLYLGDVNSRFVEVSLPGMDSSRQIKLETAAETVENPFQLLDLAISADSSILYGLQNSFFVDKPTFVRAIRLADFAELFTLSGRNATDRKPQLSADGDQITLGGYENGDIHLYSVRDGNLITTLKGHQVTVNAQAVSKDSNRLASGAQDGSIRIWNLSSGESLLEIAGHAKEVWALAFLNDDEQLASIGRDGTLRIWDPLTGAQLAAYETGTVAWQVNDLIPSTSGEFVYVSSGCPYPQTCMAGGMGDLRKIDIRTGQITRLLPFSVNEIRFSADQSRFCLEGYRPQLDTLVHCGTVEANGDLQISHGIYSPDEHSLFNAALSQSGDVLISGSGFGLYMIDAANGAVLDTLLNEFHRPNHGSMQIVSDGKILVLSNGGISSLFGVPTR